MNCRLMNGKPTKNIEYELEFTNLQYLLAYNKVNKLLFLCPIH